MGEIQEVENLLNQMKKDGKIELHSALDLIYRCGIQKKEVCSVTIGDVEEKKNSYSIDTNHAKAEKRFVKIDGTAYANFNQYFNSIKQFSEINNDSPLFPNYYGSNGESYMIDACKKYSERKIKPQTIRTAGIQFYNKTLSTTQTNKKWRYKIVAEKFRLSPRAAKDAIEGTGKEPGMNKEYQMQLKLIAFFEEITLMKPPDITMKIKELSNKFNKHLEKCKMDKEERKSLRKAWGENVSDKKKEIFPQSEKTIKSNNHFTSKIAIHNLNIKFTAQLHALLFSSIAKETFNQVGKKKGEPVICEAVKKYGQQRGKRMALRAKKDGQDLDIVSYFAYGEWEVPKNEMNLKLIEKTPNVRLNISKCPWHTVWEKNNLLEYGKYFCKEIDTALVYGFNSELEIKTNSIQTYGDELCDFIFKDGDLDQDGIYDRERELDLVFKKRTELCINAVMPWEYHIGHLFKTMGEVIRQGFGTTADKIMADALIDFTKFCSEDHIEVIREYENTDFDKVLYTIKLS